MAPSTIPPGGGLEPGRRLTLTVERVAALGRGVARVDGFTVMVARGVPGETVEAEIERVQPRFALARVVAVHDPAPERVEPPCAHFPVCGGCDWQHVAYDSQVEHKRRILAEQVERIGRLEPPAGLAVEPAPQPYEYRDKLEFTVLAAREGDEVTYAPAFHGCGGHGLVPIARCHLAPAVYSELAHAAVEALARFGVLEASDEPEAPGVPAAPDAPDLPVAAGQPAPRPTVSRLTVHGLAGPEAEGGLALIVHLADMAALHRARALAAPLVAALRERVPGVALLAATAPRPGRRKGHEEAVLYGEPRLTKRVGDLVYGLPVSGFFQVHPVQAEALVSHVVEQVTAGLPEGRPGPVLDLFCGVGLFALPLARQGLRVVGAEASRAAVQAAKDSAAAARVRGCTFEAGDLERPETLAALRERHGEPAAAIVDPPRRGLSAGLCAALRDAGPPLLVYVSCDGGTFARDAARLAPAYALEALRGFDLFPQTHHLETVGVLRRRG